jgi:RNA polymerase sigma-70 factor (ECF subfamily)
MINETNNIDDNLLVERIRQNNKDAFRLLYNRYSKKIYFYSLKYLGNNIEVEELVQSVFINVWENRESLDPANSVKSYIYKSAVNYIYNYIKKRNIHARYIEAQMHRDEIHSNHTDEQVLFNDLERSLNSVIGTLPSQQQKIFQLNHFEGLTHKEIAMKLDISVRTVENQMYRAQKTIRTILTEKYF